MKQISARKHGFTLIELIVCIAILAILAAIAVPSFLGLRESSKKSVCEANRTILLREYAAQRIQSDSVTLSAFLAAHERLQNGKTDCPSGGTYRAKDETTVLCSKHDGGGDSGGDTGTGKEDPVDTDRNIIYDESQIPLWTQKDHGLGTLVRDENGVVYECVDERYDSNTDPAGNHSNYAWRVVGTTNGNAISMEKNFFKLYLPGTTVSYDGKLYIYAPKNLGAEVTSHKHHDPNSADFIEITDTNQKNIVKPTKSTVLYEAHKPYKQGDVVWQYNKLYIATKDTDGTNKMPWQTPAVWEEYTP